MRPCTSARSRIRRISGVSWPARTSTGSATSTRALWAPSTRAMWPGSSMANSM
ncbi:hypothetical protein F443_03989 [Phytophthora nicotianae P1569]|uniref:Uncharacterized protein n=1 Tax=Phytophthora nicotianae P1569 TaxID=1317065 RepID=V9FRH7_PHYNI|nr:hypothetical protein F443_03989 [Phytophthora nicotianae P1569]